ncbi:MAG: YCF48-related protein, partial [Methanococcaceae archaeon]
AVYNKVFLIPCLLALCFTQTFAQLPGFNWRTIDTKTNIDFFMVSFPDSQCGWALGTREVIHTDDGGETWKRQEIPSDSLWLRDCFFVNKNTGFIVGDSGLILATKDGGKQWKRQNSGAPEHYLMSLCFLNDSVGWITGQVDNGLKIGGILLHTTNGGVKWDTLSDRSDGIQYYDAKFLDENNGYVLGSIGRDNYDPMILYKTSDGGKNLTMVNKYYSPLNGYIVLISRDTLWTYGMGFVRSFDGGKTLDGTKFQVPDTSRYFLRFMSMAAFSGKTGFMTLVSLHTPTNVNYYLEYSDDYAETWRVVSIPSGFEPIALCRTGRYLFVAGNKGLIITDAPVYSIVENNQHPPVSFTLMKNYPNPFNPSTTISYDLPEAGHVSLKLYSMLGSEIATLVNQEQASGRHTLQFDASEYNLSSGLYLVRISAGDGSRAYSQTIKLSLIK